MTDFGPQSTNALYAKEQITHWELLGNHTLMHEPMRFDKSSAERTEG